MTGEPPRHFSGTITRNVLEFLEHAGPENAVAEVLRRAGETRSPAELSLDSTWITYQELRNLLEAVSGLMGGPEVLFRVGRESDLNGGQMPDATAVIQDLGSPRVLYDLLGRGHTMIATILELDPVEVGPSEWLVRSRFVDGYEPYAEYCWLSAGLHSMLPRVFGFANADVVEETCERHGDHWCTYRVSWSESDESQRVHYFERRSVVLERRLTSLQQTVTELGSTDDLGAVLTRIVQSAARAVRLPAFVLAIEPLPGIAQGVFWSGLEASDAEEVAQELLAGAPERRGLLVAEVASEHRRYGRLAAVDLDGHGLPQETLLLQSYARLAATALDAATALANARAQEARTRALLELSTDLAAITTAEEMTARLARAVPAVTGSDAAVVVLVDRARAVVRIEALWGFTPELSAELQGKELPATNRSTGGLRYQDGATALPEVAALMEFANVAAVANVPIEVDAEVVGSVVCCVFDRPSRLSPTPELEEQLRGLAGQASTALRNVRLVEQIRHQALHDTLTGLPNRALIVDRAEQLLSRARRLGSGAAALFIDLDGFKDVNDSLGHAVGDVLLRQVAVRLKTAMRDYDTIARLGGDEFVVLTEGPSVLAQAELLAERILDVLTEPFTVEEGTSSFSVTASIGIAVGDHTSAGALLRDADVALYQAKAAGKNCHRVFEVAMGRVVADRLQLDHELRAAVREGQFFLVYQPIFELSDERITGVEALLRWRHPERGVVGPVEFVPMLERTGLIAAVGRWVLHEACRQTAMWRSQDHELGVSVNVSARQLEHDDLIDDVRSALVDAGLDPGALTIELTESTIMADAAATAVRLAAIKELGIRLAIDDFGTGYSSLAYLRRFPVDTLKIDRSFVATLAESADSRALIHTLVQLGRSLRLETLAEGIEDRDQLEVLRREGCQSGQGFLLCRPLEPAALEAFLAGRAARAVSGA